MEGRQLLLPIEQRRQAETGKDRLGWCRREGEDGMGRNRDSSWGSVSGGSQRTVVSAEACTPSAPGCNFRRKLSLSLVSTRSIHFVLNSSLSLRSLLWHRQHTKYQDVISPCSRFRALTISWEQYLLFLFHLTAVPESIVCIGWANYNHCWWIIEEMKHFRFRFPLQKCSLWMANISFAA